MQCLDEPLALFHRANAQAREGRIADAADTLVRCLRLAPDFADALTNLAGLLLRLGHLAQARAMAEIAARLAPECAEARLRLAGVLHHLAAYDDAIDAYRAALRLAPGHALALSSLANTLHAAGRPEEALAVHDRAVAAAPRDATCRFNRALTLLSLGGFAAGWAEYEWRGRRPGHKPRFDAPPWQGEAIDGHSVLLHAEQGLGDTLQFARFAAAVAARGGRTILQVQRPLVRLLHGIEGVDRVIALDETPPPHDVHCPLLSLPHALGTRLDGIPPPVAFPSPDAGAVAAWRRCVGADDALCVGVAWAGAPHHGAWESALIDRRRSLPAASLAALAHLPGIRFVSLQKDLAIPDIAGLEMADPMAGMADFADTAALVAALDVVIAVDSAVAHLAASMGRPVWMLSRFDGCWRWLHGRDDTPWYPTMRLYRQPRPGEWAEVLARVRHDLAARAAARCG